MNENVKGIFQLVQRLIDLAYYEYEFWDVACMKALLGFELVLKKRYEEVNNPNAQKPNNLKSYIDWFRERGYFESDFPEFFDHIRQVRNIFAHPDFHSFGGPSVSHHIPIIVSLINDLYEKRDLRTERNQDTIELNKFLHEQFNKGAILRKKDRSSELIFHFTSAFINNKASTKEYHFAYQPIFEIPREYTPKDAITIHPFFQVACYTVLLGENNIKGFNQLGEFEFELSLPAGEHLELFKSWFQDYNAYISVVQHFPMINFKGMSEIFAKLLFSFYQS